MIAVASGSHLLALFVEIASVATAVASLVVLAAVIRGKKK